MAQRKQTRSNRRVKKAPPQKRLSLFRPKQAEFRPDKQTKELTKQFHFTHAQRDTLLKWSSIVLLCLLLSVIQDVMMSRFTIFGVTTDLMPMVILLITVTEGISNGSLFVLVASLMYYFSGSAPGPYAVATLTVLGIGACMFRQLYWHRNRSSIVLCAGIALMIYEISTYGIGIFTGLTYWGRIGVFAGSGLLSWLLMIPLYKLVNAIGTIGGNTWKE